MVTLRDATISLVFKLRSRMAVRGLADLLIKPDLSKGIIYFYLNKRDWTKYVYQQSVF